MTYASPLLNYTEPFKIGGFTKTKFFSEINTGLKPGDKVFIVNGVYDNKKIIEKYPYTKGADGWTVLGINGNEIILDVDYTGTLPKNEINTGDFIQVWGADTTEKVEYQKAYTKVFTSFKKNIDQNNLTLSNFQIGDPDEPNFGYEWKTSGTSLIHDVFNNNITIPDDYIDETSTLILDNMGFNIPSSSEITGIIVSINRHKGGPVTLGPGPIFNFLEVSDNEIQLYSPTDGLSTNKSVIGDWPFFSETTLKNYGSQTDLWGYTNLTPSDINDPDFSFRLRATINAGGNTGKNRPTITSVTVTVYYTEFLLDSRFRQTDNTVLFNNDTFYKEVLVGEGTQSTLLDNNITSEFNSGSFSTIPNSNGKLLIMDSFEYDGKKYKKGVVYKYSSGQWIEDEEYKTPLIGKSTFRGGDFNGGVFKEGIFGDYYNKLSWKSGSWQDGILYNSLWETGTMLSLSDTISGLETTTAYLDNNTVKISQPTLNNEGWGLNYIIDSEIVSGYIKNGNILNSVISATSTDSILDQVYIGTTANGFIQIDKGKIEQCQIQSSNIGSGLIIDSSINNTKVVNVDSLDNNYIDSAISESDIKHGGNIDIIGYNKWYTLENNYRYHVTHKFYINERDFFKFSYGNPISLNGLKWSRSRRGGNIVDNTIENFFDQHLWMLFGKEELDAPGGNIYGYIINSILTSGIESVLVSLSTKEENQFKVSLKKGEIDRTINEYQLPSINITLSIYDDTTPDTEVINTILTNPVYSLVVNSFERGKIQKSEIFGADIKDSTWYSGRYVNREDFLVDKTLSGDYYILSATTSGGQLSITFDSTDLWKDELVEVGDYITVDNLLYVQGSSTTNISGTYPVIGITNSVSDNTVNLLLDSVLTSGGSFSTITGYTKISKENFDGVTVSGGFLKGGSIKNSKINNNIFKTGDETLNKDNIDLLRMINYSFFNRNNIEFGKAVLDRSFIADSSSTVRNAIYPAFVSNGNITFDGTTLNNCYFDNFTINNGVFNNGYWVGGTWNSGSFINSKSSGSLKSENIVAPYLTDTFTLFNTRWVKGDWKGGRFINSTWTSGTWDNGDFIGSHWLSGTWKNGKFGKADIDTFDTVFFSGTWNTGKVFGGVFGQETNSILWQVNQNPNISAAHKATWNTGVFEKGLFTGGTNAPTQSSIWETGIFNDGEFGGKAIWYDGRFNGGRFTSTHHIEVSSIDSWDWLNGEFNGGEFGTGLTAVNSNSIWKTGEFNGGVFKGRTWVNGNFYGGEFIGSLNDNDYYNLNYEEISSLELDENKQKIINFLVPGNPHSGLWIDGKVWPKRNKNIPIKFQNMIWNGGIFNSEGTTFKNSIWLNGSFQEGKFIDSSFNPHVWRINPINGDDPSGVDIDGSEKFSFNIYPYGTGGTFSNSVVCEWNGGIFSSGQFYMSNINGGIIEDGEFWTANIKKGTIKYGTFNNSLVGEESDVRWRNGNWDGSPFKIGESIIGGTVSNRFVNSQLVMNQLRDNVFGEDGTIHMWNVFQKDIAFYRATVSDPGTIISTETKVSFESIVKDYVPNNFYAQFDRKSVITKIDFIPESPTGDYIVIGEFNIGNRSGSNTVVQYNKIAKIRGTTNTIDTTFNPSGSNNFTKEFSSTNTDAVVYDFVFRKVDDEKNTLNGQSPYKIIVVGKFNKWNNSTFGGIVKLFSNGSVDSSPLTGFSGTSDIPKAIDVQSTGKVIIGGSFSNFGINTPTPLPSGANNLIRLDITDSTSSTNSTMSLDGNFATSSMDGNINFVKVRGDDKIIIAGTKIDKIDSNFLTSKPDYNGLGLTGYNGVPVNIMARLNPDGDLDTSFEAGFDITDDYLKICDVAFYEDKMYVVGDFITYSSTIETTGVIRLNDDGSVDTSFDIPKAYKWSQTQGSESNTTIGTDTYGIAPATINTITILDSGNIIIGGDFDVINGEYRKYIAQLDPSGNLIEDFNPGEIFTNTNNFIDDGINGVDLSGSPISMTSIGNGLERYQNSYAVIDLALDENEFVVGGNIIEYNSISNQTVVGNKSTMLVKGTLDVRTIVRNRFDDFLNANNTGSPLFDTLLRKYHNNRIPIIGHPNNFKKVLPFNKLERNQTYLQLSLSGVFEYEMDVVDLGIGTVSYYSDYLSYYDSITGFGNIGVAEIGKTYKIEIDTYVPSDCSIEFYDGGNRLVYTSKNPTATSWYKQEFTYTVQDNTEEYYAESGPNDPARISNIELIPSGAFTIKFIRPDTGSKTFLLKDFFVTAIDGDSFFKYWTNDEKLILSAKSETSERSKTISKTNLIPTSDNTVANTSRGVRTDNGDGVTLRLTVGTFNNYDSSHFTVEPENSKRKSSVGNVDTRSDIGYFGQYISLDNDDKTKTLHLIRSTSEAISDKRPWLDGFVPKFGAGQINKERAFALDFKWNFTTSNGFPVLYNGDVNGYTFTTNDVGNAILINGDANNVRRILYVVYNISGTLGVVFDNSNDPGNIKLSKYNTQMLSIVKRDINGGYGRSLIKAKGGDVGSKS
jgi:hypothetical protein